MASCCGVFLARPAESMIIKITKVEEELKPVDFIGFDYIGADVDRGKL